MSWLITGAFGQLGLAIQNILTSHQIEFVALSSGELDIKDEKAIETKFMEITPQVVINCAAWTDVDGAEINKDLAFAINALGTRNLALASKRIGSTFVHISTDYVFSGENDAPWREEAERKPASVYGLSKRDGEIFIQDLYPEGSYLIRTAWLYSRHGKNFAKTMANLALTGTGEVKVVNDQVGQPTSATDLANQVVNLVLSNAATGIYHGTNSGQATWFEFAYEIFTLVGADTNRLIPVSSADFPRPAKRPSYSVLSHKSWASTGLTEMRDWRIALVDETPSILAELEKAR